MLNYRRIDAYLKNNNVSDSLQECLENGFHHLGLQLGKLLPQEDRKYYDCMAKFIKIIKNSSSPVLKPPPKQTGKAEKIRKIIKVETEKKKENKKIRVKLLCSWTDSKTLRELWNKMSQGNYTWNNIELVLDDNPDYFVIINCPPIVYPLFDVPKEKTILFQMEPHMDKRKDLWGDWANPDPKKFLKVFSHKDDYNNNEWHLSKTYHELKSEKIVKDPKLDGIVSTVLSSKYSDPGHIKRVDFVKFLDKKGFPVHVYGNNRFNYKNYKGSLPPHQKDDGIFPYKYTFNVENHSIKNYYTEKVIDGILGECLVFYSGCYNLRELLPEDSFVYLELSNFEEDYKLIKKAIDEDWWSQRIEAIRKAKKIILEERNFFPRLEKILEKK